MTTAMDLLRNKKTPSEFVDGYFEEHPLAPLERDVTDGLKPKDPFDVVQSIKSGTLKEDIDSRKQGRDRKDPAEFESAPASEGAGIINRPVEAVADQIAAIVKAETPTKAEAVIRSKESVTHVAEDLDPDVMVLELNPDQLRRILGVGACSSSDKQRPILGTIFFEHRFNTETGEREFIFVATDSYTLAKLTFEKVDEYRWNPVAIPAGRMLPFAELKAAANAAIKAAGKVRPLIKVTFGKRETTIETGGFAQTIRHTEGTFPAYEKLIGEKNYDLESVSGTLPALNPDVLKQICESYSPLAKDRTVPMRMFFTSSTGINLKPIGFTFLHGNTRLDSIIMPVRVA